MSDILINYRSVDARFGAAATYELLSARFGKERLFLDNQTIRPGTSYAAELYRALESIRVLLVLIGPGWLVEDPDQPGRLLIDRDDDWVRREIRRAVERDVHIVPVLLDGSALPNPALLPVDVQPLVLRQAVEIRHHHLGADVSRLADHLVTLITGPVPTRPVVPPQQLPVPLTRFVGRGDEIAELHRSIGEKQEGTVGITVLSGAPGVGKTTLATYWAHLVKDRFPDGQLHIDLRGFDHRAAMDPAEVLHGFLIALGISPKAVPDTLDTRAALYRSTLATSRVLVVLDNALSTEQVRPLLPGTASCPVLVTSRTRLHGLAVREGAQHINLDLLTQQDARALLATRLKTERLAAEPHMATRLLEWCAGLPLALSTIGALVDQRPGPLSQVVRELGNERNRLDALGSDEEDLDLRTLFSWSYRRMSPPARQLFRLLGVHPGPDISRESCMALCEDTNPRRVLDELISSNLVTEHVAGRLLLHDLLRVYAAERAGLAAERAVMVQRIADHYVRVASVAASRLNQGSPMYPDETAFTSYRDATDWFAEENTVITAVTDLTARHGLDEHVWRMALACNTFLRRTGCRQQRVAMHRAAVDAATRAGDKLAWATAASQLASALARVGGQDEAAKLLATALPIFDTAGNRLGQLHTHLSYTRVLEAQHRYEEALRHARDALALVEADDVELRADALAYIGIQLTMLGRYPDAMASCAEAVGLYERLGHLEGCANCFLTMGMICHGSGDHLTAVSYYERSSTLDKQLGDHYWQAICLEHLGETHEALGRRGAAQRCWRDAFTILDTLGHPEAARLRGRTTTPTEARATG